MTKYTITTTDHEHGPLESENPDPAAFMRRFAGTGLRAGKTYSVLSAALRHIGVDRLDYPAAGLHEHPAIRAMRTGKR